MTQLHAYETSHGRVPSFEELMGEQASKASRKQLQAFIEYMQAVDLECIKCGRYGEERIEALTYPNTLALHFTKNVSPRESAERLIAILGKAAA